MLLDINFSTKTRNVAALALALQVFSASGILAAATLRASGGSEVSQPLAVGAYTLYFDVPVGTFPGSGSNVTIYGRFRVSGE